MNASVKEDRTTSLMKCVFHIVRSQALNGPEPQSRKDIIDNFIIIHYGFCAKDLLPIIEQMIEVKVLLPSGNREICWKGIDGRTERENSPLFTIHPECNINKYRAIETCAKHPYKYLRPPQSTFGSEVAKLTKRCVASVRSGNDLEADKLIHQAISLTKDHSRKFHKDYRFTQATMGDTSTSSIVENKSLDSCDRTNLPIVHPEDNAAPSNSQPFASLQTSRKKEEDNSGQRLGIYGITSMLRDLNSKYPNDKLKVVSKNNELWFECQDCPAKLYKISQGGSCIYHIRSHIEGAAHADRVESRVTRNSETTITTRYVQVRKERLETIRGKDPMSSRWTWWLDENQAPKSRNGTFANEKNINGTLATKSAVAKQSATPSYPEKSSGDVNLDGVRSIMVNKRTYIESESSHSSNKRIRLAQFHENTPRSTLATHLTDAPDGNTQATNYGTPSNHTQPQLGKDQPPDGHDGADREATKSANGKAVKARVKELEAERDSQGKTIAKLSRKLHKQRKIATTQQEVLEHLVDENKRHSGLLDSLRESLNIANHQVSKMKKGYKNDVTRLNGNFKFLKDGRIAVKAIADEHTIELDELRKRLQVLEEIDLGAEDEVQKRASRLRDQINGDN